MTRAEKLPASMRAVVAPEPGGTDALRTIELPTPTPLPGELVVKVEASGVNRADVMQRRGMYPPPPGVTDTLGLEFAGVVAAVGDAVSTWKLGDQVCGVVAGGSYAEYLTVPSLLAMRWPRGLDAVEAASLPEALITVFDALIVHAEMRPGERVLIHGGSSGIGTAAIQLARAWDCAVFTTASTTEKLAACQSLGATHLINYKETSFSDFIAEATDGRGVDVILDIVGGAYLEPNVRSLAPDGRMVVLGLIGGAKSELDMAQLLIKRLTIRGSTLRSRPEAAKAALIQRVLEEVWPLVDSKAIRPVIHEAVGIEDVAHAHEVMESSQHVGKIVLTI